MRRFLCAVILVQLLAPPNFAQAWSEGGHHLITLIAFKRLTTEQQSALIAILKSHPRYEQDFAPPKGLPNDVEVLHWRIGRAGYWPDVARRQSEFDRPKWHYEPGASLVLGIEKNIQIAARPGALPSNATLATRDLHLSQAIALSRKTLADTSLSDPDRAVALCWLAHLVADAHQPCHAGSLYMEDVFVEFDGDRGANRIPTKQRGNLHTVWDQLLGHRFSVDGTRSRIAEVTSDVELVKKAEEAIATAEKLDPQTWLAESREFATDSVYAPEVIDSLRLVSRGVVDAPQPIDLSETYFKNAGRLARVRAIEAAYRLAETWKSALK